MAEKIKRFFAKKKADAKFKLAGPGHKLNESSSTVVVGPSKKKPGYVPAKVEPSEAARQAAEAALVRVTNQRKDTAFNTSLAAIQAKVRRELEAENKISDNPAMLPTRPIETELELSPHLAVKASRAAQAALIRASTQNKCNAINAIKILKAKARRDLKNEEKKVTKPFRIELEMSPHLAVIGVYFRCPLISDEVLTKEEWKVKIKEFLFNTLEEERGMTACLIIYSCNYNRTKVTDCVNVLCRYLDNLIANPDETKFHKIRCSNATFCEKVVPVLGATDLLYAAGFRQQKLEVNGVEEDFWMWSVENIDSMETLQLLRDTLKSEERVELEIDRNIQVLRRHRQLRELSYLRIFTRYLRRN
ncbi:hypothetical protein NQ318_018529 [Aromia moschata]|uniref:PUB domain-containing protein n=1 Tax=Aromia moschata TaxID=1265417 RepID=A0AAV8ZFE4_9CUCU|nr:hypothetical protein NQ318_018529 [Aromia moschata]